MYIFCVIIYVIIFRLLSFCYHLMLSFFMVSKCYLFMLSFSLVHTVGYHLCYHLMLSFIVIISPLFSFSWKRDTLPLGGVTKILENPLPHPTQPPKNNTMLILFVAQLKGTGSPDKYFLMACSVHVQVVLKFLGCLVKE